MNPQDSTSVATVFVVDDDRAMRESLQFLLESISMPVQTFDSAQSFLDRWDASSLGCLLLDVRMPGMSGLELQQELQRRDVRLPVIIMTAYADVPMAVQAMHLGAMDFIEKPFNEQQLLDRINKALDRAARERRSAEEVTVLRDRADRLTPREHEVMRLVVRGRLNKQIAHELNLSMKTVEQHRAKVMEKMEADSLAVLVRMALEAELL